MNSSEQKLTFRGASVRIDGVEVGRLTSFGNCKAERARDLKEQQKRLRVKFRNALRWGIDPATLLMGGPDYPADVAAKIRAGFARDYAK